MSNALTSSAAGVAGTDATAPPAPGARQMAPLLAANFAVMASNYAFIAIAGAFTRLLRLQAWHLGVVIASVGLLWIACAGPWGRLAERVGHAAALRRALAGVAIAFALLAGYLQWALAQPQLPAALLSLAVLLIARAAAGACTAGVPVTAIAWIAGRTAPAARAAVMARYGAAGALGMVVAPPAAGALGAVFLPAALLLGALLPLVPLAMLGRLGRLAERAAPVAARGTPGSPVPSPARLRPLDPRLRLPWLSAFAQSCVIVIANVCIGFYLIDRLGASPAAAAAAAGSALGAAGLALMLTQAFVSRRPEVTPLAWLRGGALLGALGFGSLLLVAQPWMVAASFAVAGCGIGMAIPAIQALAANRVEAHEQGACAAAMSTAQGASMVVAPVLGAALYELAPAAPFVLMPLLLTAVLAAALRQRS